MFLKWLRFYLLLATEDGSVRVIHLVLVLKAWRGCTEVHHCVVELESLKRAQERLVVEAEPSCSRGMINKKSSSNGVELA